MTPCLVKKFKFKGDAVEALEVQIHFFFEKNGTFNKNSAFVHMATSVWSDVKTPEDPLS